MAYHKIFMCLKHAPEIRGSLKQHFCFSELLTQIRQFWNADAKRLFSEFHIQQPAGGMEGQYMVLGTRKIKSFLK